MARNFLFSAPPLKVEASIKELGSNLRVARLRRGLTIEQVAKAIGTGVRAVRDAEGGKPTTAIAIFTSLLWMYHLLERMSDLANPFKDEIGLTSMREPKRGRRRPPEVGGIPSVYFIGDHQNSVVKIGKSNTPKERLKDLQTSNSGKLELLAVLTFQTEHAAWTAESELHAQYQHLNVKGEWFRLEKDLEAEIIRAQGN